jgi:hypothetical protein
MQQLREILPDADHHGFVILDRDSKFSPEVIELLESSGIRAVRASVRVPGRMARRNAGSAARAASASTM